MGDLFQQGVMFSTILVFQSFVLHWDFITAITKLMFLKEGKALQEQEPSRQGSTGLKHSSIQTKVRVWRVLKHATTTDSRTWSILLSNRN